MELEKSCPGQKVLADSLLTSSCQPSLEETIENEVLQFLIRIKGFTLEDIERDVRFNLAVDSEQFSIKIPFILRFDGKRVVLIHCGPGSVLARQRAGLAMARLIDVYQIPLTLVTNGKETFLMDTLSGRELSGTLADFPSRDQLLAGLKDFSFLPLSEGKVQPEKRILCAFEGLSRHGDCA